MAIPPRDKSFQGLLKDHDFRIALVERRLGGGGSSGGGISKIVEGPGIDITGTGSTADPLVITAEAQSVLSLPAPVTSVGPSSSTVTATAFEDMPGMNAIVLSLTHAMYARIDMQAIIADNTGAYTMLGATVSGATTLSENENGIGGNTSGLTPFGYSAGELAGSKIVLLNAGTNTITLRRRRSAASGTHTTNYSIMHVTPIAWVGQPGAVVDDTGWIALTPINSFVARPGTDAPAYRIKSGIVYLSGHVVRPTAPTALTAAFSLPVGARPRSTFHQRGFDPWDVTFEIQAGGDLLISSPTLRNNTATFGYSIGGITYPKD